MSSEAKAEIEDCSFPCYKRLDTLREAEGFLEDWNYAYADSWRWAIKERLSNGWVANIDSVLFKIMLEVQSPHKPKSANDRVLSGLEKLEEEQKNQIIQPASRLGLQSTARIFDEITHRQGEINAKEAELVKGQNLKVLKGKTQDAVEVMFTANEELMDKLRGREEENGLHLESLGVKDNDLNERAEQISRLKSELKNLQAGHFREIEKAAQLSRDITSLQEVLKAKDKMIDKMKDAGSNLKMLLSEEQKKNAELEKERNVFHEEGQKTLTQLRKLESFAVRGAEADEYKMMWEFSNLWDHATSELAAILNQNLSAEALSNKMAWDKFQRDSELAVRHHIPLLASNSPAAKGMRLAVILAILAREIDTNIFQPNYLFSDTEIRAVLCKLATVDREKESFCRSMLLSIDQSAQQVSIQSTVQYVARNVSNYLFDVLSESQFGELRQRIENVVKRAIETWRPIQSASKKYETDFEPLKWDDDDWSQFQFPGDNEDQNEVVDSHQGGNFLTIFPRISWVNNDKRYPQTFAIQLMGTQKQCLAAEQERYPQTPNPKINRTAFKGSRRASIAQGTSRPNGEDFLEQL
ncbi:hypothetical protein N7539_008725 [Penicillium diatomitis]|uniref:Uncharacterized protein n=1 Tax=Penicillium diatomitis TaxID=2819901 RepID=A0A9W9WR41_9EURO|nr:uncharacterized protein N7539_008725 [Penicillium diatomitis]KAJ5472156.1 hypothetical protein N7539_008725 [Penicillium diatomitis]